MGLRQVQTGRSDFLPQEGNGIEADELRAMRDVDQESIDDVEQNIRVGKVEVYLIVAEGCPHLLASGRRIHLAEERQSAWAHNMQKIGLVLDDDEVAAEAWIIAPEGLESLAAA